VKSLTEYFWGWELTLIMICPKYIGTSTFSWKGCL